ncbi:UvrD-helicase domain-containing protein [Actinomycetospora sp. TBRC 11914]|uniref:UvrD-helicase domain-containing protein n=1 Tax=Actinomycetospora sp. TBRC 11914 TaxID=2729387 RepID=UPI00145EB907|nr:UvrD-helicase domain-containing protein [Actinomycetospora sp. TBRC 11914]NMO91991.1 UvrD-helicase domain-containing protein [Actinomycetospora sp. TBRC 11914]
MSAPTAEAVTPFDVLGRLPQGTTVLEASAGTGKTYTIAALAARYVAEAGVPLSALMLVTFGREATRELRERVRERLVAVERALAADEPGTEPGTDPVTALVVGAGVVDDAERTRRRRRLAHALAHFDEATIATTHQFCQDMLAGLGVAGDTDADARFVEQIDDVVAEVVDDFYVRAYAPDHAPAPPFDRTTALALGRAAVADPTAVIAPAPGATTGEADARARFAAAVRDEVDRRKRTRRLYTFDDMLTRLHAALVDPRLGGAACARLRQRYRVVLVDEFQDTDPTQWDILRVAFHGHSTLTVIGDPKQAIYAFRGADVVSYLAAASSAGTRATLATNHRSDAGLLAALDTVFGGAALGDERIVVHPVAAAHEGPRLAGAPDATPFRLRVVPRAGLRANWRTGLPEIGPARARVAADLTADVTALLASHATWEGAPLSPGHLAVLVRTNAQADLVRDALAGSGVPAVLGGAASVFATEAAREWLALLEALEQPGRVVRVRAAALTCFVGKRAAELDADPDGVLAEVGEDLRRWAAVLRDRGVAAMLEAVSARHDLVRRVLGTLGGERLLTDVRHVGQVLHAEAAEHRLGVVAITEWLRLRIVESEARRGEARPERTRRLESDDDAVQILTVHKCKGLEFPVVYVPFGWDRWVPGEPREVLHHDAAGRRVRAVGGPGDPAWGEHTRLQRIEDDGEDLRLLYVALTRAQGQVVAWWAPSSQTAPSALNRVLRGRAGPGVEPHPSVILTDDTTVSAELAALAGPHLAVEPVETRTPLPYVPPAVEHGGLGVACFDRELDLAWRRSSYSSLTADAHAHGVPSGLPGLPDPATSEPEEATVTDEADLEVDPADTTALPSPMADLPLGPAFGVLVHSVLETVDTASADLGAALTEAAAEHLARRPLAGVTAVELAAALEPVVRTPVERDGWAYADIAPGDRLAELDFELPLAGGDRPGSRETVTLGRAAALLRDHLPPDDPLAGYPEVLETLAGQVLRGYLTGSIDAVLRTPDGRFVIVDHKTNWLGPAPVEGAGGAGDALTSAHYGPAQMTTAMIRAHYPLQALLYGVALHRFLRWRLPSYRPDRHLGGVAYLFLRGMCGPDTPVLDGTTCGVFRWSPPPALTVALSDLLAGGPA